MNFDSLLDWLSEFDPRLSSPEVHAALILPAVQDLQSRELDPDLQAALERLLSLQRRLRLQQPVGDELDALFMDFAHLRNQDRPAADLLESDLLTLARRLPRWEWNTQTYAQAVAAVAAFQAGDQAAGEQLLEAIEARLERAWEPYYHSPIEAGEMTAEAVAGHRMVHRGTQGWFEALACLREAAFEEGLRRAEHANRVLVAMQKFAVRIERQVRLIPN